jgi:plastocyanin
MQKTHAIFAAAVALFAAACISGNDAPQGPLPPAVAAGGPAPAMLVSVEIAKSSVGKGSAAYGTNPFTIDPLTRVTWTNDDTVPHTATSDSLIWDSGSIAPGASYSFVFTTPGSYPYHDTIYGQSSMSGTIEVRATVSGPAAAPASSN